MRQVLAVVARCCAALLICAGIASPGHAQTVAEYLALVRQYAAGQGAEATAALDRWPSHDVDDIAIRATVALSTRDLVAAAMLHTDLANLMIDGRPDDARSHLDKAQSALTIASSRIGQRQRLAPFVRRWFRFVASVYLSAGLPKQAAIVLKRGLILFPGEAPLYVARGIMIEVAVRKTYVFDWRRDATSSGYQRTRVEDALDGASQQFVRALAIDPHNAEAHLHLGWIRFFRNDGHAGPELNAAIADADDDTIRYLAHLFLGGIAERANHLDEALREYDAARALGAGFQTPLAALSRVEDALGHTDRARELALIAVGLDKSDSDDPWWDHRIGFDRESLRWLRAEVRKP
jgi:tetratricopeptide (TPR) repeat protein